MAIFNSKLLVYQRVAQMLWILRGVWHLNWTPPRWSKVCPRSTLVIFRKKLQLLQRLAIGMQWLYVAKSCEEPTIFEFYGDPLHLHMSKASGRLPSDIESITFDGMNSIITQFTGRWISLFVRVWLDDCEHHLWLPFQDETVYPINPNTWVMFN